MRTILALACLTLVAPFLSGCTDESGDVNALEAAGYKSVHITGYAFFGCAGGEAYHTGFTAIGQNGKTVTGVVCAGASVFGKASTIRIFN